MHSQCRQKKWIDATNVIGIVSKAGRYGGTYAHSDIAMSFATWISPEFQLYMTDGIHAWRFRILL